MKHVVFTPTAQSGENQPLALSRRAVLVGAMCVSGRAMADGVKDGASQNQMAPMALWPGMPPGGGGPGPVEPDVNAVGAFRQINTPFLRVYMPATPTGAACLVASGGGYRWVEDGKEGDPAAQWLAARGIIACVLRYRLPREDWNAGPLAPLQDAQRAIRLMRSGLVSKAIDPKRLFLLGFSAGGHLLGMAATRPDFQAYPPIDAHDTLSLKVAALAMIYPVITLLPPYDHTSTRVSLVGLHPSVAQAAEWSVQNYVTPDCPPCFMAQAQDDTISNPLNTAIFEIACRNAHVPVERVLLPSGGHGFGMGRPGTPAARWGGFFEAWLKKQAIL